MNGNAPDPTSTWYTEPLRRVARWMAGIVVLVTMVLDVLNEVVKIPGIPQGIRVELTAAASIVGILVAVLVIVQAELGRGGVPLTKFNGVSSPRTVHRALVASVGAPAVVTPAGAIPDRVRELGEAAGLTPAGNKSRRRARRR